MTVEALKEYFDKRFQQLEILIMKDKVDTTWIPEDVAAKSLGLAARTLRRQVKKGLLKVEYRTTNGRNYQYSRKQLQNFRRETAI